MSAGVAEAVGVLDCSTRAQWSQLLELDHTLDGHYEKGRLWQMNRGGSCVTAGAAFKALPSFHFLPIG